MYERILFVCTGNTCRSPMAQGLLRKLAEREGLGIEIRSAGVAAINGMPISRHSADILKTKGFHDSLASSALSDESAAWADLILTMTAGHKQQLIARYPEAVDKVFTLKEFAEDNPAVLEAVAERQRLYSNLQIKQALGEAISEEEIWEVQRLENEIPSFDISDPYGGDRHHYELCAKEIEEALHRVIRKLKNGGSL